MSGSTSEKEDRTEAPTDRRRQRARDEGQIPVSREAVLLAGLAAMTLAFATMHGEIGLGLTRHLIVFLADPGRSLGDPRGMLRQVGAAFLAGFLPFAIPLALGAIAATVLQTRLVPRWKSIEPDIGRISPGKGLKRLLGADSLMEAGKSIAKLAIVAAAVRHVLIGSLPLLQALPATPLTALPPLLVSFTTRILVAVILAQTAIAAVDLLWVWRRHTAQLRMSRSDIKDEHKETEGDPAIKMRIRRLRMRRARQRMMAAVPTATVVVTNPTHFAIALTYDTGKSNVPTMVAKGADAVAARIREAAQKAGVPIVSNPPLARTLFRLPVGAAIPPELYQAVAEIIAYIWRLGGRR